MVLVVASPKVVASSRRQFSAEKSPSPSGLLLYYSLAQLPHSPLRRSPASRHLLAQSIRSFSLHLTAFLRCTDGVSLHTTPAALATRLSSRVVEPWPSMAATASSSSASTPSYPLPPTSYKSRPAAPIRSQLSQRRIDRTDLTPNNIGTVRKLNSVLLPVVYSERFYKDALKDEVRNICKIGELEMKRKVAARARARTTACCRPGPRS